MLRDDQAKILIFLCFEAKISQALLIIESKKFIQNVATSGDINATYIYRNRSRFACREWRTYNFDLPKNPLMTNIALLPESRSIKINLFKIKSDMDGSCCFEKLVLKIQEFLSIPTLDFKKIKIRKIKSIRYIGP